MLHPHEVWKALSITYEQLSRFERAKLVSRLYLLSLNECQDMDYYLCIKEEMWVQLLAGREK
jgi:hypothetical protein